MKKDISNVTVNNQSFNNTYDFYTLNIFDSNIAGSTFLIGEDELQNYIDLYQVTALKAKFSSYNAPLGLKCVTFAEGAQIEAPYPYEPNCTK